MILWCLLLHPWVRLLLHPWVRLLLHSWVRLLLHSWVRLLLHSWLRLLLHSWLRVLLRRICDVWRLFMLLAGLWILWLWIGRWVGLFAGRGWLVHISRHLILSELRVHKP